MGPIKKPYLSDPEDRPSFLSWGDLIFTQELLTIVAEGLGRGHSSLHVSLFIAVMRTTIVMRMMMTFYGDLIEWNISEDSF